METVETRNQGVRPEIQALRTVAVLGVVLYHLWPNRLSGGYVGVDVFFVVSGLLITDHLLREVERSGGIHLPRFWARRARRLLPASFLVIAATAVAVYVWVPENRWPQFGRELLASTFYVENWELARQAVDYMAQSNVASPTQHFWSLGVEEQFYLAWPLLILAVVAVAGRIRRDRTLAVGAVLAVVLVASLAYSHHLTETDPGRAYFSTFTRAWEFAAGGLLAWWARRHPTTSRPTVWSVVSWAGLAAIGAAMLTFDEGTAFPGYAAALPVVGAVAVMLAGAPGSRLSPVPLMRRRPIQWIGDISYGVYLWHWPLIILIPFVTGSPLSTTEKIGILVATLVLAHGSKTLVEDPLRRQRPHRATRTAPTFVTAAVASAAMVLGCLALVTWKAAPLPDVTAQECSGASALVEPGCADELHRESLTDVASFATDLAPEDIRRCELPANSRTYERCEFGSSADTAPGVALIGDSHATRLADAVRTTAEENDWRLSTFLVSGCPMVSREWVGSTWGSDATYSEICRTTAVRALDEIAADPTIDVVLVNNRTRLYMTDNPDFWPIEVGDVVDVFDRLEAAGKRVVLIRDVPEMRGVPVEGGEGAVDCLTRAADATDCSVARDEVRFDDPLRTAAERTGSPVVDLDDLLCDPDRCYAQIGGVVVYTDDNHLTATFVRSAQPAIAERLTDAVDEALDEGSEAAGSSAAG